MALIIHAGPAVKQLIAAAPQRQAGMAAQTANHRRAFLLQHGVALVAPGVRIGVVGVFRVVADIEPLVLAGRQVLADECGGAFSVLAAFNG